MTTMTLRVREVLPIVRHSVQPSLHVIGWGLRLVSKRLVLGAAQVAAPRCPVLGEVQVGPSGRVLGEVQVGPSGPVLGEVQVGPSCPALGEVQVGPTHPVLGEVQVVPSRPVLGAVRAAL